MNWKKFFGYLTIIFFIFFEVYSGIRLLTNPIDFTNSVIFIFGIIMLIIGVISIVRALKIKSDSGMPYRLGFLAAFSTLSSVCYVPSSHKRFWGYSRYC